jgi:hypothetical protein
MALPCAQSFDVDRSGETFKLLRTVLRAPAIVSPAAILIAGLVTGHTEIDPATGRRSVPGLPT